jgi:hypothetical protein
MLNIFRAESQCAHHPGIFCDEPRRRLAPRRSPRGRCGQRCFVPGCMARCALRADHRGVVRHYCGGDACPHRCAVAGCDRRCAEDHWHPLRAAADGGGGGGGEAVHHCGARDHTCGRLFGAACAACGAPCGASSAVPHARHECADAAAGGGCTFRCSVPGCGEACAAADHMHGYDAAGARLPPAVHRCGRAQHPCGEPCAAAGCGAFCAQRADAPHAAHD